MPTPRKPVSHHKLAGSLRARHAAGGPPVCRDPVGGPPPHFNAKLAALWDELIGILPAGVVAKPDRLMLELAVVLMARLRQDPGNLRAAEINQLRSTLSALGCSPQGRSLIVIPPVPEASPADGVAAKFFFDDGL